MSDDLDSRNAGLAGMGLPANGNVNEWQAGRSIRAWNDAQLAAQNAPIAIPDTSIPRAPATPIYFGSTSGPSILRHKYLLSGPVGLVLMLLIGAPLYYLSIPLWFALYPAAGLVDLAIFVGVFMYASTDSMFTNSGLFAFPAFIAFIAGWVLTAFELVFAKNNTYWKIRHFFRVPLIGLWVIYVISDRAVFANHVHMAKPQLPPLQFTPRNILIAVVVAGVMHLYLTQATILRKVWRTLRGQSTGFQRVS